MKKISLEFQVDIIDSEIKKELHIHGPLFHRWLPDGEKDKIILARTKNDIEISVWFNRYGVVIRKFCIYNPKKKEIKESIMRKQGKLEAGRLFVRCDNIQVSNVTFDLLKRNTIDHDGYKKIGKDIAKEVIPQVNVFINTLKINYGQYWLTPIKEYDSRIESIGNYWSFKFAHWKTPRQKKWTRFTPDNEPQCIDWVMNDKIYTAYLTKSDWENIGKTIKHNNIDEAAEVLLNSYKLIESDNIKYAFLEATLALELALSGYYNNKYKGQQNVLKQTKQFFDLSLSAKMVVAAASFDIDDPTLIDDAIKAIKIRNKIAHEGYLPKQPDKAKLMSLLDIVNIILPEPKVRKVELTTGNSIMPVSKWNEIGRK